MIKMSEKEKETARGLTFGTVYGLIVVVLLGVVFVGLSWLAKALGL